MGKSSRRLFIKQTSAVGIGSIIVGAAGTPAFASRRASIPAVLGGTAAIDKNQWVKWPIWNPETDEKLVMDTLRSGVWSRAKLVTQFEEEWAKTIGTKRCLTTVNGTNALVVALNQLGIQGGDEVIVPPYTFVATIQAVLVNKAIPVFVDVDPDTFQIDPDKIEEKITSRTKAIMPVHILGLPANMERIMAIAKKHNLIVIEDACQAPLAEINGKRVGSIGDAGCFSFQNSKNIAIGEGGAITSDNEAFVDRCYSYHNLGLPYGSTVGSVSTGSIISASKFRLTEYQAAIGFAQLSRLEAQTSTRNINAAKLSSLIKTIPGITTYRLYDSVSRAAFHLFPFRYDPAGFKGLSRGSFLKALQAEGLPASGGYTTLNTQPFIKHALESADYRKLYPKKLISYSKYMTANHCPKNDKLCLEAIWFTQNVLLGNSADMESIAGVIRKVQANADKLKKSLDK